MELTRKQKILKLIVEDFIKYAEPVGSKYLIEKYKLDCSSATVRNVMAELEEDGLIEKTHTSSGRIPSTAGYRYYIDNLRDFKINDKFKNQVSGVFASSKSIDEVIHESCEILSSMTNLTSVVLGPDSKVEALAKIQIIPLNDRNFTAIFVTNTGYCENKTFKVDGNSSIQDIQKCVEMLNKRLVGTTIDQLVPKLETLKPVFSDYITNYSYFFNSLVKTFVEISQNRNEFYGKEKMLIQPEFTDNANELKKVFDLFSNPDLINQFIDSSQYKEIIDSGEINKDYENLTIIYKDIKNEMDQNVRRIAVIGPKRMDYEKVLNSLDYIIDKLNEYISSNEDGIDDKKGG